jgi:uncharacterized protein (DUF885 family)
VASPAPRSTPFHAWMDGFFASYYARRPVNATFVGVHEHDHRLPDLSDEGLGDTVADMEDLLRRAEGMDVAGLAPVEEVDLRLARGYLRTQLWELGSAHFQAGNPSFATGEAIFGVMSLFLSDFAPLAERMATARARLEAVPTLLAQGRDRVRRAPPAWTRRALVECTGATAFLSGGMDLLEAEAPPGAPRLRDAADRAAAAFEEHATWLRDDLARRPSSSVACGEEALALHLQEGHFLEEDAQEIAAYARHELEGARAHLAQHASDFGAASPAEALAQLAEIHPSPEGYYARYGEIWDEMRALVLEHDLLTWPDFPIRYVPRPRWARAAAPHLYFLPYRSPAAFGRPPVHDYLVTPLEADLPDEERRALLEAHNDSVIKLNHVVHHGGIGHHVQNWHAFRSPSRVGRVAAVDCASRIAMFCGGTMAEGWACYATDLVSEVGGLTPLEAYAEKSGRARMCARAIVDVELHHGRMSLEEAAAFYREQAGMSPQAATAEAVKNSMFPGAALMYLVGTDGIHALRRAAEAREGAAFSLRDFHDRLLRWGSIPVTLAGALMARVPGEAPDETDGEEHR